MTAALSPSTAMKIARPFVPLTVEIRADCDCGICRAERGLKPLSDAELTAKRESKAVPR